MICQRYGVLPSEYLGLSARELGFVILVAHAGIEYQNKITQKQKATPVPRKR